MISDRPYRERMTVDEACAELESCAGTQFDPEVVKVFVEEVRRNPPRLREDTIEPVLDAELEIRRGNGEPMLGYGSVALIDHLTLLYSRRHLHEVAHAEAQPRGDPARSARGGGEIRDRRVLRGPGRRCQDPGSGGGVASGRQRRRGG
jgi:hypothetical protein